MMPCDSSRRVLHLIDSGGFYGAERVLVTLLNELNNSPFPGVLGCIKDNFSQEPLISIEARKQGIDVELFTMQRGISPSGISAIMQYVRNNDIRVIHCHGYKPDIFMSLAPRKGIKVLATVHGWSKQSAGIKGRIYETLDAFSLRRMDRVIAVSQGVIRDLLKRGIRRDKIDMIHNGITLPPDNLQTLRSVTRDEYGIRETSFVIGAVGRLIPVKGFEFLINAMAAVVKDIGNCRLLLAGDGPQRNILEQLITKLGLSSNVELIGYQPEIVKFLSAIDLFVMPSLSEGLPMSLLEAMACEKPVLATSVGGIPEVLSDETGVLIEPADINALADNIAHLYENNSLRSAMAERGKQLVKTDFSSYEMAKRYLSLYSGLRS